MSFLNKKPKLVCGMFSQIMLLLSQIKNILSQYGHISGTHHNITINGAWIYVFEKGIKKRVAVQVKDLFKKFTANI